MKYAYISENNITFNNLLSGYNEAKEDFLNLAHGQMPANFYAFDTRFKLSSSMEVRYSNKIIKSKPAKTCYTRLVKLTDLWFTYEILLSILYEKAYFTDKTASSTAIKNEDSGVLFDLNDIVANLNNQLNHNCLTDSKSRIKIQDYISDLVKFASIGQIPILNRALAAIKSNKNLGIQELIAIILAVKILFVEKGDTSVARIKNLQLAKSFFEVLYDFLLLSSIKIATVVLKKSIFELTN